MPLPRRQGLYDPAFEHDACGLGFVATLDRTPTHEIVEQALEILVNLTHRGAAGCDPCTGDGAGILLQIPHELYAAELAAEGVALPPPGEYAVAMCFFSRDPARRRHQEAILEAAVSTTASVCSAGATSPSTRRARPGRARVDAVGAPALHRPRADVDDVRAAALPHSQARRPPRPELATTSTSRRARRARSSTRG